MGLTFEGLLFEVERPELAADESDRRQREQCIAFYQRLGARPLKGIDYVQPALGEGKRPVRMHLFYHPAEAPSGRPHGPEGLDDGELYREFMRQVWGAEP